MITKSGLLYTKDHEWVRVEGDRADIGITDHAQESLGAVVFVELPAVGKTLVAGGVLAVVESVKAASDVLCPVSGAVLSTNEALSAHPELLNDDPYGQPVATVAIAAGGLPVGLMDEAAYQAFVAAGG